MEGLLFKPGLAYAAPDPTKCNVNTTYTVLSTTSNPKTCDIPECEYGRSLEVLGEINIYCRRGGTTTSAPSCPKGTGEIKSKLLFCRSAEFQNLCCEYSSDIINEACKNKSTGEPIGFCEEILANAVLTTKSVCTDPTTKFNNKVCEKFVATLWALSATCTEGNSKGKTGIQSAIGCIPTESLPETLGFVLKFALGAAGGVIILMLIVTGYGLLTSQGNPEKLAAAKENVVSIFSGLILIVFSLVLLQTIGANILGLPTF